MDLADLFPDQSYEFRMGLRRGEPAAFFRPREGPAEAVLEQRRRAIQEDPAACLGLLPAGEPLLVEAIAQFTAWKALSEPEQHLLAIESDPFTRLRRLGERIEPDLLLLAPGEQGRMHLLAGCVCFPSSWFLSEKLGKPMAMVHEPAPGLNRTLGSQIDAFLSRLRPGAAWLRNNWGLSASADLNQRPDRSLPKLTPDLPLEQVWLRVERQALAALPESGGVLFGIRIETERLSVLLDEAPDAAARLAQALRTMPEEVARYKEIAAARARLLCELEERKARLPEPARSMGR